MPLPLLAGFGAIVSSYLFKASKFAFKWGLFVSLMGVLTSFIVTFWGFFRDIYANLQGSIDSIGTNYTGLLGCAMTSLGIDTFFTSALAIFVSASVFWGVAVSYIVTFKFGTFAYKNILRLL